MQSGVGRVTALLLVALVAACATPRQEAGSSQASAPAVATPTAGTSVAAGNRAFGLALYQQLAAEPGNVFISPISIAGAFGPVIAGADGATRQAIARALRFPAGGSEELHPALGGMLRDLESKREGATISIANALWVSQDFRIKPSFLGVARDNYGAAVETLDFARAPGAAADRINSWVSKETRTRIPTLVSAESFDATTRLVVTNAVYFLGDWAVPFNQSNTSQQPFYRPGAATLKVPLMYRGGQYRYFDTDTFQAIDLPYKDEALAMTVFLPKKQNGLRAFEAELSAERLREWLRVLDQASPQEVRLYLPKLKIEQRYDLVPSLRALDMSIAFNNKADFSGIADEQLRIGKVIHKTFVRIDEKGTEAAAATGIEIVVTGSRSPPPPTFRADHPFFFLLRDKKSGAVLFMGRIVEPGPA